MTFAGMNLVRAGAWHDHPRQFRSSHESCGIFVGWQPTCDANIFYGQGGVADLWPTASACYGIADEAEEVDKLAVDPAGKVYVIDGRYRVAKINSSTGKVDKVLQKSS